MPEKFGYLETADSEETPLSADAEGRSVPWAVNDVDVDSRSIFIAFVDGDAQSPCGAHLGSVVVESETTITIRALSKPDADAALCRKTPSFGGSRIDLKAPLGQRTIYHAALAPEWAGAPSIMPVVDAPSPSPTPTITATYAGSATCESLLGKEDLQKLSAGGYVSDTDAYIAEVRTEPDTIPFHVLAAGGMLCAWSAGPEQKYSLGYGPISDAARRAEIDFLTAHDVVRDKHAPVETYVLGEPPAVTVAFGTGYWVVSIGAPELKGLPSDVIARAPAF